MSSYGNTSPWVGSIGRWWCGRLCWGSGRRRRGVCWGIRWNASIAIDDPDVCAVDKCFLLTFPHATVIRTIASPAVCHAPPPLYHATITCQPRGKLHLDRKHLILFEFIFHVFITCASFCWVIGGVPIGPTLNVKVPLWLEVTSTFTSISWPSL